MRILLLLLIIILALLLVANLFIWAIAPASGHRIPAKTNFAFGLSSVILLLLLAIVIFIKQRLKNKE